MEGINEQKQNNSIVLSLAYLKWRGFNKVARNNTLKYPEKKVKKHTKSVWKKLQNLYYNIETYQIDMYTLNLHNIVCQIHFILKICNFPFVKTEMDWEGMCWVK